jgi:hypothetical protein
LSKLSPKPTETHKNKLSEIDIGEGQMQETEVKEPKRSFSIDRSFLGNYVLTQEALREAFSRFKRDFDECKIAIAFASEREVEAEEIQDALTDPLIRSTHIQRIAINASTYVRGKGYSNATLYLSSGLGRTSSLRINDNRERALSIEHDIAHILNSCRVPFGFLNPNNYSSGVSTMIGYMTYGGALTAALAGLVTGALSSNNVSMKTRVIILLVSWSFIIITALATTMFPRFVFDFGAGERIWKRGKAIRNFVFWSLIFEFIMGVLAIYFTDWLKG